MPRATWSGSISFGLVNVPVKMFVATRDKTVRFSQVVRDDDGAVTRVRQRRVAESDGREVAYEQIQKGYEVGDGRYVVIDPEELEALDPEATRTVDVVEFVDAADIDPLMFDRPYWLAPAGETAHKPYRLLADALKETDKVAIGSFVMRTRSYLVAIREQDGALVCSTLNYHDEVIPADEVIPPELADVTVSDRERKLATQLIDQLATDFDPAAHVDEHRERVLELVEAKISGAELPAAAEAGPEGEVVDLMAALEQSLAEAKKREAVGT
jgi:DNA end-binding protein Ku